MWLNNFSGHNKIWWALTNLGTLPLNAPWPQAWHKVKLTSIFQQICKLLTLEIVIFFQSHNTYCILKIFTILCM